MWLIFFFVAIGLVWLSTFHILSYYLILSGENFLDSQ